MTIVCNGRNPIKDDMGNCDVSGVAEKLQVLCHAMLSAVMSENFLVNPLLGFAGRWTDVQFDLATTRFIGLIEDFVTKRDKGYFWPTFF